MPMPWRRFILMCMLIISFTAYFINPFQTIAYTITIPMDEEIGTVSDFEYPILTLTPGRTGKEFSVLNGSKKFCGEYFFTIRYGEETYIGFYLSSPNDKTPALILPLLFPRKSFI